MVSIGEEIISFDRPRFIFLVDCIEIARWSGVEHLHSVTLLHTCLGGGIVVTIHARMNTNGMALIQWSSCHLEPKSVLTQWAHIRGLMIHKRGQ